MIFESLRDRVTVSIDIPKSRKRSKQTAKRSKPAPEPRKRTATPQTRRTDTETKRVAPRSRPANPRSTPTADTRTYRSTTGGLFYATGRDGRPQGYPRLSGMGKAETKQLSGWFNRGRTYYYWISLDERGDFMAAVDDDRGKKVMSIASAEDLQELIDAGYMKHGKDVAGLEEYLQEVGIIESNDKLVYGDWSDVSLVEDDDDDEEDGSLADSLADLAGITESELAVANRINERLEYLDDVFHDPIRVFCTKSKKNPYMVRRLVLDCNAEKAMNRGGYSGRVGIPLRDTGGARSIYRHIGMGPKSRAKYFPKHYGVTWEYIVNMSNKEFTVKNRIQEHLDKQANKNAEKITAVSTRRAQREERIAEVRREREARQAAQAERIAKRREEREAKRKPVVEVAPQPKPVETVATPKPKTERKPKAKPEPNAEPLTTAQMDSIESDMQNLIALLQAAKKN